MDDHQDLILAVRHRALNPSTRTDWARQGLSVPDLAERASASQLDRAERALGFHLHPMHKRLLEEIGNGGFGPGDGLIGLPGGRTDDDGRTALDIRDLLLADGSTAPLLPLWDWGDGTWACVDCETGLVTIADELGVTNVGYSLAAVMGDWALGLDLTAKLFTFTEVTGINPFTNEQITTIIRGRPAGTPY